MAQTMEERMAAAGVHGLSLAIIDQGRLARTEGYGLLEAGTDRHTQPHHPFHACSISKTVTAMTALSLVQDRVIDPKRDAEVACGHDRHGRVIPGRRPVYPCLGPAGVWSSAGDLAQVALEVMAAMQGQGRVLTQGMAAAMTTPPWHPLVGLGIFLDEPPANGPWYYHYGWGEGFQGALSLSPALRSGVVILMNAEPGVPQWQSLVGEVARLVAAEMGWSRSPTPALS